jgi:hypothetical protein
MSSSVALAVSSPCRQSGDCDLRRPPRLARRWLGIAGAMVGVASSIPAQRAPRYAQIYPLGPAEGVFAYARISPDARYLAYAAEGHDSTRAAAPVRTINVVDLQTHKVVFREPGIDAYWSVDGQRIIYQSHLSGGTSVSIRHMSTGETRRTIAPVSLGDYYSWGRRDGRDVILTVTNNFYYLNGDVAELPPHAIPACTGIGVGERPLLSKDGRRVTTFVRGTVVVRGLTDCDDIIDTALPGAKADFSWDGRYLAFHVLKQDGEGYNIAVVDIARRTVRTIADFEGSSFFPSWTKDGRLCFRYDGPRYRGFMMASDVLSAPERPLPADATPAMVTQSWSSIFPKTSAPASRLAVVMIWATWSAHSPAALADLQRASDHFVRTHADVRVLTAIDPASRPDDVRRLLARHRIRLSRLAIDAQHLAAAGARNQMPTTLLFRDGRLVDRRLGAQSFDELLSWIERQGSQANGTRP